MVVVVLAVLAVVVLVLLGVAIVGLTLKLLWWALIGLVIGALGRLVLPGSQPIGVLATAGAGIAAALLGGIIAYAFDLGAFLQFIIAVALAAVLIAAFAGTRARSA